MVSVTARHDVPGGPPMRGAATPLPSGVSLPDHRDFLRILHRRRRLAVIAFLLVALPPLVMTFTAEAVYEGSARVRVGLPLPEVGERPAPQTGSTMNDYVQLFMSRRVARRALEELHLWNPPFERSPAVIRQIEQAVSRFWPQTASAATPQADPEPEALRGSVDALLDHLTVTPVPESRLIDIRVSATDAAAAAKLTNAVVRQAIGQELDLRLASTGEASRWFSHQLEEQRARLDKSEAALQKYKEEQNALSVVDRQNIVVQKLSDLNAAVTRAKTERIAKEALYRQVVAMRATPSSLDTLPGAVASAYVRQLKDELATLLRRKAELSKEYGDLHPEIASANSAILEAQSRMDRELNKIAESIRNDYQAAAAQERSLSAALEAQKSEALDLNRKGLEYGALEREAVGNRELYDRLLQQAKQTGLSSELKAADMAVVDAAEPPAAPARPARARNALASLGGGLFAAIGLAVFVELLDKRIKTPDQIKRDLGLPYLGYLPLVRLEGGAEPLLTGDVDARFHEAVRRVRANLLLSSAADGCRTVVVTSTAPREGKTMVSTNLALALAQGGLRVVLVDADLRRPRIHLQLGMDAGPGLTTVLTGLDTLDRTMRQLPGTSLSVLTAGVHPPNPPELLSSARYRALLTTLQERFDWVVIDSPPIMAVADAALLAKDATGILFVVGAEMAAGDTVREAVDQMASARVPILGAVLNKIDVERNGFYYSRYYNPDYEQYYA